MDNILDEATNIITCKECPWYKSCVTPMRFSSEDVLHQFRQNFPGSGSGSGSEQELKSLLSSMASAAENILLEGCPVFIQRLKANPKLVQQIKLLMSKWGQEDSSTQ